MNTRRTRINIKPFCKVCRDAGKCRDIYTSHFPRESPAPESRVVCPTLLNQKCNYCHMSGHTIRHCSVLRQNKNLKSSEDVQIHVDIEREIRIAQGHYENMNRHPNNLLHPDTRFFPVPAAAAGAAGSGGWDWGGWGGWITGNFHTSNGWGWQMVPCGNGGFVAQWAQIGIGTQNQTHLPIHVPPAYASNKRQRIDDNIIENEDNDEDDELPMAA